MLGYGQSKLLEAIPQALIGFTTKPWKFCFNRYQQQQTLDASLWLVKTHRMQKTAIHEEN